MTYCNFQTLTSAVYIILGSLLTSSSINAKEKDPTFPVFSKTQINCEVTQPAHYSAKQNAGDKNEVFKIHLQDCITHVETNLATKIIANFLVEFPSTGDISHCNALAVSLLVEVSSKTKGFEWSGKKSLIETLDIKSVHGDSKALNNFSLHDGPPSKKTNFSDVFSPKNGTPKYNNLFWGVAELLQANSQSAFVSALRKQLPFERTQGVTPDYVLDLKTKFYKPRGICFSKGEGANAKAKEIPLTFTDVK